MEKNYVRRIRYDRTVGYPRYRFADLRPKRIKSIGSDLGSAIKGFRKAVTDDEQNKAPDSAAKVIDGEADTASASTSDEKQNV